MFFLRRKRGETEGGRVQMNAQRRAISQTLKKKTRRGTWPLSSEANNAKTARRKKTYAVGNK